MLHKKRRLWRVLVTQYMHENLYYIWALNKAEIAGVLSENNLIDIHETASFEAHVIESVDPQRGPARIST